MVKLSFLKKLRTSKEQQILESCKKNLRTMSLGQILLILIKKKRVKLTTLQKATRRWPSRDYRVRRVTEKVKQLEDWIFYLYAKNCKKVN